MITHGKSSVRFAEVPETVVNSEPGILVDGSFPYEGALRQLMKKAAASGVGVSQWEGDDGQLPLAHIPVGEGKTFAEMAHERYPNMSQVEALNMLLFTHSACYVEKQSMVHSREFGSTPGKEKFIGTLNLGIAESWLGGESKPAIRKRLSAIDEHDLFDRAVDSGAVQFPYVKLDKDRGSTKKIVSPRTKLELNQKKTDAVPLFMYEELINHIYAEAQDKLVRVSYRRTSGEIRVMDTTWNREIIAGIYGDDLADAYLADSYAGDFSADGWGASLHRGYVRVPSVGESKYDGIVRSLNFASIFKIEYVDIKPNLMYVNVNIPHVPGLFMAAVETLMSTNMQKFQEMCRGVVEHGVSTSAVPPTYEGAQSWLNRTHSIEGTGFYKRLSLFMMSTPEWFPNYTGDVDKEFTKVDGDDSIGLA